MDTASILNEQVERLFGQVDRAVLQNSERGAYPAGLWAAFTELGVSSALVAEQDGGAGLSWQEVGGVFEALGYFAAPVPAGEAMIGAWAQASAGLGTPEGLTIALDTTLDIRADRVSGSCTNVPWANRASQFLTLASDGARQFICMLPAAAAVIVAESSLGRDPRAKVSFDRLDPIAIAQPPIQLAGGFKGAIALLRANQIAGALARCLELAVEYGNTRVQFGRPIGKFQALQHMMAELACEAAAAKAAAGLGLRAVGGTRAADAIAIAKVRASISAGKGAAIAHAVHGAIGVTEEHVLHYYTRRLWQWRDDAGTEHFWAERLGRHALGKPGGALWPAIVGIST